MFNTELNLLWMSMHSWLRENGPQTKDMCPWIPIFYKKGFPEDDTSWHVGQSLIHMPVWDYEQFGEITTTLSPTGASMEWLECFADHGGERVTTEEKKKWEWIMPAEILQPFLRIIQLLEEDYNAFKALR